ncbi:hypothetical protein [Cupriavidus sp. CuC1]|uniref:hypothetical protein n=1 Tax=Cupriavidus sp. CuC1 TaxID=3373131 RepID=UPI0037D52DE8
MGGSDGELVGGAIFNRIFLVVPGALLITDLALLGSGQWSDILGFSVRKLLLLILAGYSTLLWVRSSSPLPHTFSGVAALALFVTGWSVMIPLLHNTPLSSALADSQLFLGLLFAPALALAIARANCWSGALRLIERLIWILALLHIAIFWYEKFSGDGATGLVTAMRSVLEPGRSEDETSVFIGPIAEGFRVFWGSSVFLLLGLYLSIRNFARRRFLIGILIIILISYAIQLTLTRAMLLSVPIFLVLSWLFDRSLNLLRLGPVLYLLVGVVLLMLTLPVVLMADPHLLTAIGLGREISDDLRYQQVMALGNAIMANPWFGSGLGAHVDLIRSEGAPWSYELSMLALYMKTGFFGVLLLLWVFIVFVHSVAIEIPSYESLSESARRAIPRIAALLFCIIFCSNTNPYLFSMLGWGLLMFVYIEFFVTMQKQPFVGAPV